MYGYVYKITCKVNNKLYIGKTTCTIEERFEQHYKSSMKLKTTDDYRCVFHNAIKKYGIENFEYELIDEANSAQELNEKEIYWIAHYNSLIPNGYNMTTGGDGTKGFKMPQEAKDKISKFQKKQIHTAEWNKKVGDAQRGRIGGNHVQTEEEKRKRVESIRRAYAEGRVPYYERHGGRPPMTEEEKRLDSEDQKGKRIMNNSSMKRNMTVWKDEIDTMLSQGWEFGSIKSYSTLTRKEARKLGII